MAKGVYNRFTFLALVLGILVTAGGLGYAADPPQGSSAKAEIKFLYPGNQINVEFDDQLSRIVRLFEQKSQVKVSPIPKGDGFSSIRELMVGHMAGSTPDLVVVEASEMPTLQQAGVSHQASKVIYKALPVVAYNQEFFFRHRLPYEDFPSVWKNWLGFVSNASEVVPAKARPGLVTVSTSNDTRLLWILEDWAGMPLWERKKGGVSVNRKWVVFVNQLRGFFKESWVSKGNFRDSLNAFSSGRVPVVFMTSDRLPLLRDVPFRWDVSLIPRDKKRVGKGPVVSSGMVLVLLSKRPEAKAFFDHFVKMDHLSLLARKAGGIPLEENWKRQSVWKKFDWRTEPHISRIANWTQSANRQSDVSVVRAREAWNKRLNSILLSTRDVESIFADIDLDLARE